MPVEQPADITPTITPIGSDAVVRYWSAGSGVWQVTRCRGFPAHEGLILTAQNLQAIATAAATTPLIESDAEIVAEPVLEP